LVYWTHYCSNTDIQIFCLLNRVIWLVGGLVTSPFFSRTSLWYLLMSPQWSHTLQHMPERYDVTLKNLSVIAKIRAWVRCADIVHFIIFHHHHPHYKTESFHRFRGFLKLLFLDWDVKIFFVILSELILPTRYSNFCCISLYVPSSVKSVVLSYIFSIFCCLKGCMKQISADILSHQFLLSMIHYHNTLV
jgi:hypothetical protein